MSVTKDCKTSIDNKSNNNKESFLVLKSNPKVLMLRLKDTKNYKATMTLSSNEEFVHDVDSLFDIIASGKLYQIRIIAYIKRNNSSVFYDDFDYTKCMPTAADIEIVKKLIEEINSKASIVNR